MRTWPSSITIASSGSAAGARRADVPRGGSGTREHAHAHLTTATTMYREMDMRFWLEQAEREEGSS